MQIINLGNIVANNYLLNIDGHRILIDTGYPGGFDNFQRKLGNKGLKPSDINYVVLTHAHDDHAGFLNEVLQASKARLVVNRKSIPRLQLGHNLWIGGCPNLTARLFVAVMGMFGKGSHEYPIVAVPTNSIIWENEAHQPFAQENIPLRVIGLPGHTEDSIGIVYKDEILFCGDAAMNGFPSVKRNIIWIENFDEYKKSWDVMISTKTKYIYPAHGKPFLLQHLNKYRKALEKIKISEVKK